MDTSDAWIRERTGIERRHSCRDGETNVDMAEHAARAAIAAAGLQPTEIDLISYGTTTPDLVFPNSGALLQARLGCRGAPAFSLEAACSGFIYALAVADKFVRTGECAAARWWWARKCSRASPITTIAVPRSCSAMAPAPWCWPLPKSPGSSRPICMPMAATSTCCTAPAVRPGAPRPAACAGGDFVRMAGQRGVQARGDAAGPRGR